MSFTVDYATDTGLTRLLAADVDSTAPVYTDDQISAFLTLQNGNVRLAAATALESMAVSAAWTQGVVRTLDLSTDGRAVAQALMARAKVLRDEDAASAEGDYNGMIDWAEQITGVFGERERIVDQWLRAQT